MDRGISAVVLVLGSASPSSTCKSRQTLHSIEPVPTLRVELRNLI